MSRIEAVLLDVDGTLVDSNLQHARAWVDAFREFGVPVGLEVVRPLIGMGSDQLIPRVVDPDVLGTTMEKLADRRGEIFRTRYLSDVKPFPRVRDLLQRMRDDRMVLVVATSGPGPDARTLLDLANVTDLVQKIVSADDADRSKPAPDIIEVALESAAAPARAALMLGDTPWDVVAAKRVGIGIVALRCGGASDAGLEGALAIYDDPAALFERYERSPFVS